VATTNALTNCRNKFENKVPRIFGPKPNEIKQDDKIKDEVEGNLECTAEKRNAYKMLVKISK
jgi:hypothetical protein